MPAFMRSLSGPYAAPSTTSRTFCPWHDRAAKGFRLVGVRAMIGDFEHIHRLNLVGMGVLPLEFFGG
jgi:hypothetical protein